MIPPPNHRRRRLRSGYGIAAGAALLAAVCAAAIALPSLLAPAGDSGTGSAANADIATAPQPTVDSTAAQTAVDAEPLPVAIGWADDDAVWTNDTEAHPIASLSKVVTALVGLERQPLALGDEGPVHVWDERDQTDEEDYLAADGVVFPIPLGTEVTAHEMLTLMMLPSANDFASAYARSVFGDDEAFVAAVDAWAVAHGLDSLHLAEPSGMDADNVASTEDLVRIARLALQQPVLAELASTATAELPWGIGEVVNTNPLLGAMDGVIGLKTGQSDAAGFTLLTAQREVVDGRERVKITAVLGASSDEERAAVSAGLLDAMSGMVRSTDPIAARGVANRRLGVGGGDGSGLFAARAA